jgi:protein TonB
VPSEFATVEDLLGRASALDQIDLLGKGSTIVLDPPEESPEPGTPTAVQELPRLLHIEPPVYPSLAREAGIEGTVTLRMLVGRDGRVKHCAFVEGNSLLKDAAIASAWTTRFSPAMYHNEPVEVWVLIPIQFSLK